MSEQINLTSRMAARPNNQGPHRPVRVMMTLLLSDFGDFIPFFFSVSGWVRWQFVVGFFEYHRRPRGCC